MDFSHIVVNVKPVFQLASAIVSALVGLIVVRKVVRLSNRS